MFNGMNGLEILKNWPRYEDGEPVRPGDRLLDKGGDWFKAVSFVFTCDWWSVRGYQTEGFGDLNDKTRRKLEGMAYGTCVKRPAPKVLDADGVEIHVGDEVWSTTGGFDGNRTVKSVHVDEGEPPYAFFEEGREPWSFLCCCLTHRAPVLAADGEPLEVGQTVYHIADGKEYTVEELFEDGAMVTPDGITGGRCRADYLTHERPDSWERLEEDAMLAVDKYRERYRLEKRDGMTWPKLVKEDLVRRARALAEKED